MVRLGDNLSYFYFFIFFYQISFKNIDLLYICFASSFVLLLISL